MLVDRYLIREMLFPFVLAVVGFVLFIVLNLIPQLSDFMLDRNIPIATLFQMLGYRLPELLVYGLPVGVLFAIFWALGRLSHDRELIALQAAGFSLRRLMLPVVLMGLITTIAAFAVGELWMPWANHRYYDLLREIFFMRSVPQIRESTFIKLSETAYAYIERYDPATKKLVNVMIFDKGGGEYLAELEGRFPKIIVAAEGVWDGDYWRLTDGKLHKLSPDGRFEYTVTFEKLSLRAGPFLQRLFVEQRTPHEMSIAELFRQIEALRRSGLGAESLIVEVHSKIAVPFSALIFALFGAPLSLIFAQGGAPRGRAAGVIISVLLVGCYQGLLLWLSTLGKRGVLDPVLAPWAPNLLFLVIGVVLLIWLDRLSRLDLFARLRRLVPFALIIALGSANGWAQELPPLALDLHADRLTVTHDWSEISAEGHVELSYEKSHLTAHRVQARRSSEQWQIVAEGEVVFEEEGLKAQAERLELRIRRDGASWQTDEALLERAQITYEQGTLTAAEIQMKPSWVAHVRDFLGETRFESAAKKQEILRFAGSAARATFSPEGHLKLLEITRGEVTTCSCGPISCSDYSLAAGTVRLEPNESIWATNITLKTYGVPVFWAPVYFASLKEETKNPLLPDFGQIPERGWYLRWRWPFVIDKDNTGTVLIDYYTKLPEVGMGIEYRYRFFSSQGQISVYRLVGRGESWATDWTHRATLPFSMTLSGTISWRTGVLQQEIQRLSSRIALSGGAHLVRWNVLWSRDQYLVLPEEREETVLYRFLEKAPEFSLSLVPLRIGSLPLSVLGTFSWGRYREKKLDRESLDESARWDALVGVQSLALGNEFITVQGSASYRLSFYEPAQHRRDAYELTVGMSLRPLSGVSAEATYSYRRVFGQSPLSFDTLTLAHTLAARATWATVPFRPALSVRYDFIKRAFEPLQISLKETLLGLETRFDVEYDLNAYLLQRVGLTVSASLLNLQLSTGYKFAERQFEDTILKISWGAHRLGANFDLNRFALRRFNLETQWLWNEWELTFGGEYDLGAQRWTALQVGIIKKFCRGCWQLGLYSDSQRLWIQAQINAFPTARVRYSPTDRRLSFGSP
jgi:LPS export ABC transporter permease LptF